jgi:hypothetical protein
VNRVRCVLFRISERSEQGGSDLFQTFLFLLEVGEHILKVHDGLGELVEVIDAGVRAGCVHLAVDGLLFDIAIGNLSDWYDGAELE